MRYLDALIQAALPVVIASLSLCGTPARADVIRQDKTDIGDALNLPVYKWSDDSVPTKGVILGIHGATLYAKRFETTAKHFAKEGYPVYAVDMRGFGAWRTQGEDFAEGDRKIHYTMSENDLVNVLTKLRSDNPNTKVYCMGESLGANLAVWVGSEHPQLTDGLVLVSPCVKSYLHPTPYLAIDVIKGLIHRERSMSLTHYIKPNLCDDKATTAEYMNDPGIVHAFSPVDVVKSIKTNTIALMSMDKMPQTLPVLVVAGKKDRIYKASAIPPFVAGMGSKRKTVQIIPKRGHLLIESPRVRPDVLSIIDRWLVTSDQTAQTAHGPATTADAYISGSSVGSN
jgi:alpha-beta hydrolase superfamily lysophospholipase